MSENDWLTSRFEEHRPHLRAVAYRVNDPIVTAADPEHDALLADSVGLALLVVLETLPPAERLAFVLHDMFAVSFDEIAPIVGRSATAARQLASRARRRVQGAAPRLDRDRARQRAVVDAFFAAARDGNFEALVAVLDPDVVLRADSGPRPGEAVVRTRCAGRCVAGAHVRGPIPRRATRAGQRRRRRARHGRRSTRVG